MSKKELTIYFKKGRGKMIILMPVPQQYEYEEALGICDLPLESSDRDNSSAK